MNTPVLVLNQNYEPLNICGVRRAIVLVLEGKADVLEQRPEYISTPGRIFSMPSVIRLRAFVRRPRPRVRFSRREIFLRDNFTCQYCGVRGHDLTVDHVIPRSRGGQNTWENVVCACRSCNHQKGGKSVDEARMHPRVVPHEPRPGVYYSIERRLDIAYQPAWHKFLPGWGEDTYRSHALLADTRLSA